MVIQFLLHGIIIFRCFQVHIWDPCSTASKPRSSRPKLWDCTGIINEFLPRDWIGSFGVFRKGFKNISQPRRLKLDFLSASTVLGVGDPKVHFLCNLNISENGSGQVIFNSSSRPLPTHLEILCAKVKLQMVRELQQWVILMKISMLLK